VAPTVRIERAAAPCGGILGVTSNDSVLRVTTDVAHRFLEQQFARVHSVELMQGGQWSAAFAFSSGEQPFVVRFGRYREDFDKERVAAGWEVPGLPCPRVLEIGDAFDGSFVVSERHFGTKLADLPSHRVSRAVASLVDVLAAMRTVDLDGSGFGIWLAPSCNAPAPSWSDYLVSLQERDEQRLVNWRAALAARPEVELLFHRACDRLERLVVAVPNERCLVHSDLLLNHLVGENDEITAVFDWGNALAGDPLYDIAWIAFCVPWFPAIPRAELLRSAKLRFDVAGFDELIAAYELRIGAGALQYLAYASDDDGLRTVSMRLESLLSAHG
jgi:hygromycin-B 4-O-kinase